MGVMPNNTPMSSGSGRPRGGVLPGADLAGASADGRAVKLLLYLPADLVRRLAAHDELTRDAHLRVALRDFLASGCRARGMFTPGPGIRVRLPRDQVVGIDQAHGTDGRQEAIFSAVYAYLRRIDVAPRKRG